jgi:hypothetical protein
LCCKIFGNKPEYKCPHEPLCLNCVVVDNPQ